MGLVALHFAGGALPPCYAIENRAIDTRENSATTLAGLRRLESFSGNYEMVGKAPKQMAGGPIVSHDRNKSLDLEMSTAIEEARRDIDVRADRKVVEPAGLGNRRTGEGIYTYFYDAIIVGNFAFVEETRSRTGIYVNVLQWDGMAWQPIAFILGPPI